MRGKCRRVEIQTPQEWKLAVGESVNIDGICSTVVAHGRGMFAVEYMPETLSKTTAATWLPRHVVNLERSLKWQGRIHGHFVAGHVDARGVIADILKQGRSRVLSIKISHALRKFVAPRGSISIDGASLTIARIVSGRIEVALIPHTLRATNLGTLKQGDVVNIECDLLTRYTLAHTNGNGRVRHNGAKRAQKKK